LESGYLKEAKHSWVNDGAAVWSGIDMDKQSTIRSIRSSYKIDQVENGWTVSTGDGNMFVFAEERARRVVLSDCRGPHGGQEGAG